MPEGRPVGPAAGRRRPDIFPAYGASGEAKDAPCHGRRRRNWRPARSRRRRPGQAALVANQVLAELAMVDLEAPGDLRGIVVAPPPGAVLVPGFLSVVLAGLHANPLLHAVPLAQMFRDLLAGHRTAIGRPLVRQLEGQSVAALGGTDLLATARATVSADARALRRQLPPGRARWTRSWKSACRLPSRSSQRAALIGAALRGAESRPGQSAVTALQLHHPYFTPRSATSNPAVQRGRAGEGAATLTSEQLSFVEPFWQRWFVPPGQPRLRELLSSP